MERIASPATMMMTMILPLIPMKIRMKMKMTILMVTRLKAKIIRCNSRQKKRKK